MVRQKLVLAGTVAAVLGVSLLVTLLLRQPQIRKRLNPPQANLPDDSEVERMRATLYQSPVGFHLIEEFDVPPEHIPRILFWFRPSTYEPQPPLLSGDTPLGELKITTTSGETRVFKFYWSGVNPPVFTENDVDYYFGGGIMDEQGHGVDGGIRTGKAIEAAHSAAKNNLQK